MKLFPLLILAILHAPAFESGFSVPGPPPPTGQTETIVMSKKNIVEKLRGVILDQNDAPMEDVNIDVLNDGQWIIKGEYGSSTEQHIVASTKSDAKGEFRFQNLPAGKYDVRFTAMGFNDLHIYVEVRAHHWRSRKIKVVMRVAT